MIPYRYVYKFQISRCVFRRLIFIAFKLFTFWRFFMKKRKTFSILALCSVLFLTVVMSIPYPAGDGIILSWAMSFVHLLYGIPFFAINLLLMAAALVLASVSFKAKKRARLLITLSISFVPPPRVLIVAANAEWRAISQAEMVGALAL